MHIRNLLVAAALATVSSLGLAASANADSDSGHEEADEGGDDDPAVNSTTVRLQLPTCDNMRGKVMSTNHVQEHIDLIAKHEEEFLAQRTLAEKVGDRIATFAGSLAFVGAHLLLFACWLLWNSLGITSLYNFDPAPFSLLGTFVAMEGLLLASFILMRQSRTSRRSDERDHLMLQILLLTEKEITAVLSIDRQIAAKVGLERVANSTDIRELSQHTSIDDVAQTIRESLPEAE